MLQDSESAVCTCCEEAPATNQAHLAASGGATLAHASSEVCSFRAAAAFRTTAQLSSAASCYAMRRIFPASHQRYYDIKTVDAHVSHSVLETAHRTQTGRRVEKQCHDNRLGLRIKEAVS